MPHSLTDGLVCAAGFYDLLQADSIESRAQAICEAIDAPRCGALDLAAGTGLAAIAFARAWPTTPVVAVEPSQAMRSILLTNLRYASDVVDRVTIQPSTLDEVPGSDLVDVVTLMWAAPMLAKGDVRHDLTQISRVLQRDGLLVTETQTARTNHEFTERDRQTATFGQHTITYTSRIDLAADGSGSGRFSYEWHDEHDRLLWSGVDEYVYGPLVCTLHDALADQGYAEVHRFDDPCGTTFSAYQRR